LREELLNFWCQLENVKGSRRTRALSTSSYDPIAFHRRNLRPYGVGGEPKFGGNVIDGQAAALKKGNDPPPAGIE
jgi:hypothetical protein